MDKKSKIYVAGHQGMVGSAIWRALEHRGHRNLIGRTIDEMDLTNQMEVDEYFKKEKPEYVFLAAAKVGGIQANNMYRADFIYVNLAVQTNVIHASFKHGVKKLLFLGSSCIYPRECPQPIKEEYLLTGPLESTNEPYAIAKIAGLKMCESYNRQYGANFISAMPTNLYGPNDNFDLETSHVLPALINKFVKAKVNKDPFVTIWGSGKVKREFLHVDDAADACLFLMEHDLPCTGNKQGDIYHVNVGVGTDITISELAEIVRDVVGYEGDLIYDDTKPDGTPRKLLDVSRLASLGWYAKLNLQEGIKNTVDWYRAKISSR